jgi:hypothetical protein
MSSVVHEEDDFIPDFSEVVASYTDLGSADAIAGVLQGESVHAKVKPVRSPNGPPTAYHVCVDSRQLHRARWILQDPDLTEAELTYLATGKLGEQTESES